MEGADGVLVPGGFGNRGVEGMITAIEWARMRKVPEGIATSSTRTRRSSRGPSGGSARRPLSAAPESFIIVCGLRR